MAKKGRRAAPREESGRGRSRTNGRGNARGGKPRRRRSFLGSLIYGTVVLGLWCLIALAGVVTYHATQLPPIDQLQVPKRPPNIAILASDGTLLANRGETGGRNIDIDDLPKHLPGAFVAIEDRRFYSHFGIDPIGIARALVRNVSGEGGIQGGSTLTQQLAKNLFLTQERTASRKIQEAILALWLERNYSKREILELYMNRVYFGSGAYGVEAAAQRYFDKSAEDVTLAEAAMLAGLVQAPSRLAPTRNPKAARDRAALVLAAMLSEGMINQTQEKTALAQPAVAARARGAGTANYAADYVMDVLDDFIGTIESDVVVTTTIDLSMQREAEAALIAELDEKGKRYEVAQGALVSIRPDGAVKALVGGRNYAESQFNRAVAARRQPGSAFKPFVYLAAIERGLTPDTIRTDGPVSIRGWNPENFSRDFRGPVTLRNALALSLNTVAVKLAMEVGPREVVRTAQRLGIASSMQPNASIALGTSEVTPIELTAAFAAFANGGIGVIPYVIDLVQTTAGEVVYQRAPGGLGRVMPFEAAAMMNAMMRETLLTGTARRADLPGWEAAGKTGTSQDFRDAWFVGYTGSLVTGVWLGNDGGEPTKRASGGNLPVEVWSRYMKQALAGTAPTPLPGDGRWQAPLGADGYPVAQATDPRQTGSHAGTDGHSENAWVPPSPQDRGLLGRLLGIY